MLEKIKIFIIFLFIILIYSCGSIEPTNNYNTNYISIELIYPTNGVVVTEMLEFEFKITSLTDITRAEIKFGDGLYLPMEYIGNYYYEFPSIKYFSLSNRIISVRAIDKLTNTNINYYYFALAITNILQISNYSIVSNTKSNYIDIFITAQSNILIYNEVRNLDFNFIPYIFPIKEYKYYFDSKEVYIKNLISSNYQYYIYLSTNDINYFNLEKEIKLNLINSNQIKLFTIDQFAYSSITNIVYLFSDTNSPYVSISFMNNFIYTNTNYIKFEFNINDDFTGLKLLTLINYSTSNTNITNFQLSGLNTNIIIFTDLYDNSNNIIFFVEDNSGNISATNIITVFVDKEAPLIFLNDINLFVNNSQVQVSGVVIDNAGLSNIYYSINNSEYTILIPILGQEKYKNWSKIINLPQISNTVKIFVKDNANNSSITNSKVFIVDNIRPILNIDYNSFNNKISNNIVYIAGNIIENESGIDGLYYSLNNIEFYNYFSYKEIITNNFNLRIKLNYGNNNLKIFTSDKVSNNSITNEINIYNYGDIFIPDTYTGNNEILIAFKIDYDLIDIIPFIYGNMGLFIDNGKDYNDVTNGGIDKNGNGSHILIKDNNTSYYYKKLKIPDNFNYEINFILYNYDTNKYVNIISNFWDNIGGQCLFSKEKRVLITNNFQSLYINNGIIQGIKLLNKTTMSEVGIITNGILISSDRKKVIIDIDKQGGLLINTINNKTIEDIELTMIWTNVPKFRMIIDASKNISVWDINNKIYKYLITNENIIANPVITGNKTWMHKNNVVYYPYYGKELKKINEFSYGITIKVPSNTERECIVIFANSIGWLTGEESSYHSFILPLKGNITNVFYFDD